MKTKTNVKSGLAPNHNQSGLRVRTQLKSGALAPNHNPTSGIAVKTRVKSGALAPNHNPTCMSAPRG